MKRNVKQMVLVFLVFCLVFVVGIDTLAASKKTKSVTLNHKEYTVKKGKSVKLKATVSPKNAKNKTIEWTSSNKKVATVNSKGKVTAKKQGTAKITAKVKGTKIKAVCKITVGQPISKITVKEKKVTMLEGETKKIKTTIKPAKASNKGLEYSSSNKKVATVDAKGVVTAKASGKATITVTAKDGSKKKATVKVTVNKKVTAEEKEQHNHIKVTGVTVDPTSKVLKINETVKLVPTIVPANATDKKVSFVVKSGTDVATVDQNGVVTAKAAGEAVVAVVTNDGKKEATCKITVEEVGVARVSNQDELNKALAKTDIQTLKIETEKAVTILIPEGNYENVSLVVNAPEAHIENKALFKEIRVDAIGANTFVEQAEGNSIYYGAISGTIRIEEGSVSYLYVIEGADRLNLVNDGNLAKVMINTKVNLSVSGESSSAISMELTTLAQDSSIISSKKLMMTANAKVVLTLLDGAEESEVNVNSDENIPSIIGLGRIQVTITEDGEIKFIVGENDGNQDTLKKMTITGVVMTSQTEVAQGANVHLIPYRSEITEANVNTFVNQAVYSAQTNENGEYQLEEVTIGNYILLVQKEGYCNVVETLILTDNGADHFIAEKIYLIAAQNENVTGNLSGVLRNAQDGSTVPAGITVRIRSGKNNISGDHLFETVTNENGAYSFENLKPGQYTIQVIDYREDVEETYVATLFNAVVYPNQDNIKNGTITAIIGDEQIRFVLRWGDETSGASSDLDSHLVGPKYGNKEGEFHTWYSDMKYSDCLEGELPVQCADLDVDDTTYEGPETTTIYLAEEGEYRFYIHDYIMRDETESMLMANSSATVEVYKGSRLKAVYNVPNQPGNLWYVCNYYAKEDKLVAVNTVSDWTDELVLIGMDQLKYRRIQLAEVLKKANTILPELEDGEEKTAFGEKVAEAQELYDTSEDLDALKEMKTQLEEMIEPYENSVRLYEIYGGDLVRVEYDENRNIVYAYGRTEEVTDYEVYVPTGSTYEIVNLTEGDFQQKIIVTGKANYKKTYYVQYQFEVEYWVGIDWVTDDESGGLNTKIFKADGNDFYILNLRGTGKKLSENMRVYPSNGDAQVEIEESDLDGYLRKVTITCGEYKRVYYVTYDVELYVFGINDVTDGNNYIVEYDYVGDGLERTLYIKGLEPQLSSDFSVEAWYYMDEINITDSDVEGYEKKVELVYGTTRCVYYVKYEQDKNMPHVISIVDKENAGFRATINHSWCEISATGMNDALGENLEVVVPEGMSYEIQKYSYGDIRIVVDNGDGWSRAYDVYYTKDDSPVCITSIDVVDNQNVIDTYDIYDTEIFIYGKNNEMGDTIEFVVPEGATVSAPVWDAEKKMYKVTVSKDDMTKDYWVKYNQSNVFFELKRIEDSNNEIEVSINAEWNQGEIVIVGSNDEIGTSLVPVLAEGLGDDVEADVEYLDAGQEDYKAYIIVRNGNATYRYNVYYVKDVEALSITYIMDGNEMLTYVPAVSENSLHVFGKNEDLGENVQIIVPKGSSASALEYDEENGNYSVTVSRGNNFITYAIYYFQSADFFQVDAITDENNQIEVDIMGRNNQGEIQITGANPTLGNTLQVETNYQCEVNYDVDENAEYDAIITIINDGARYNYYVYYTVNA